MFMKRHSKGEFHAFGYGTKAFWSRVLLQVVLPDSWETGKHSGYGGT